MTNAPFANARKMPAGSGGAAMQIETLESQLKRSLTPVIPDEDFVHHLHDRLKSPNTTIIERRQNAALGLLILAFSLAAGLIVVWLRYHLRSSAS
jgi:hypothetical protein